VGTRAQRSSEGKASSKEPDKVASQFILEHVIGFTTLPPADAHASRTFKELDAEKMHEPR